MRASSQAEAPKMPTCRYSKSLIIATISVLVTLSTTQVNCQTHDSDCPHKLANKSQRNLEAKLSNGSRPEESLLVNPQQQLAAPHLAKPMERLASSQPARQQRQFSAQRRPQGGPMSGRLVLEQQQTQESPTATPSRAPAVVASATATAAAAAAENEEFSLALGSQQVASNNSYTIIEPTTPSQPPQTAGSANQSAEPASTTPALPGDSIGSPVALQPPATTTSSLAGASRGTTSAVPAPTSEPPEPTGNQVMRRTGEEAQPSSSELPGSPDVRNLHYGFHLNGQSISSSPSSISIITPLVGAPNQQSHTASVSASIGDSALMKPILVLGNPISERDYNAPEQQGASNHTDSLATGVQTSLQARPAMSSRIDKTAELEELQRVENATGATSSDRMSGPPLVYSDGHLGAVSPDSNSTSPPSPAQSSPAPQPPTARLLHGSNQGAAVMPNSPRRPSLPPPVNQANAASGFRSPMSPSGSLIGNGGTAGVNQQQLMAPVNSAPTPYYQTASAPYAGAGGMVPMGANMFNGMSGLSQPSMIGNAKNQVIQGQGQVQGPQQPPAITGSYSSRRPLNITRVEHISAECSDDLIRAVIVFNGTFKGIIYSSGYVNDPTCLYVNGTGLTRYEFSIRLNQCGTLGRQELHQPKIPGEARRRDQVMWNTLSIQYNSIIEQEWDEHFRVSCEYGSDFWKTVSFSPFNVETNTGSPVVFTINPPQCQMDVLLGHGMGPKIAVDGPVTVGDPLTLLIHMKSEKAGYDILVKNCVAHNGGKQRMQLIDSNGCVVNERFISPFRGTYNDNDLRHVTLYAYLKAFRFTGSPVLYLECEIHMCQSACPPQMCYWRRLSKRSVDEFDYEYTTNSSSLSFEANKQQAEPVMSESLNLFKALQVRHESPPIAESASGLRSPKSSRFRDIYAEDDEAMLICYRQAEVLIFLSTVGALLALVVIIAVTCCMRVRKLSSQQYRQARLKSPSLLSISDVISCASGTDSILTAGGTAANLFSYPQVKAGSLLFPTPKRVPQIWPRLPPGSTNKTQMDPSRNRMGRHHQPEVDNSQHSPRPLASPSSYLSSSSIRNFA